MLRQLLDKLLAFAFGKSPAALETALDAKSKTMPSNARDWRNSIVDLMKLADMDSSLEARKVLAKDLGYSGALDGSAAMNIWLHEKVMERLRWSF